MNIADKVKSMREQLGQSYQKPNPEKLIKFKEDLLLHEEAMNYLMVGRGLTKETIEHFELGYDVDRDAIAIPVFKRGELINIKYRFINPKANKYSGERGAEAWIYNEDGIQKGLAKGSIIIVEGEFDLMSVWQSGSVNVVSSSAGKEAYGTWIEYIDNIPKVYIAYDNDAPGKEASSKLAERLGTDKCVEIIYPEGIKDANEFFKKFTRDDFIKLAKNARPYYTHQFKGVGDVINSLRNHKADILSLKYIPNVRIEKDWLIVVSGVTNIGKTSYILNLADELVSRDIPVLVMPFERGIESVGGRFLQVKMNMDVNDLTMQDDSEWERTIEKCIDLPIYFAVPDIKEVTEVIIKSKRIFNTKVVMIDHLDILIRNVKGNKEAAIGDMLKELKNVAIEHDIVIIGVSHIRKMDNPGGWKTPKNPGLDDLKGSSSLNQDPECVIMLRSEAEGSICVDILKNKGEMTTMSYAINNKTGRMGDEFIIGIDDIH